MTKSFYRYCIISHEWEQEHWIIEKNNLLDLIHKKNWELKSLYINKFKNDK